MRRRANSAAMIAAGLFLLTHGGHFYSTDAHTVFMTSRAMIRGGLAIQPTLGTVRGLDGESYGMYAVGLPLLWVPFAMAGDFIDGWAPGSFARLAGPAVSIFYPENFSVFSTTLVGVLFGALLVASFWVLCEALGYSPHVAAGATAMLVFGTQVWPAARDSFPQIVVAFCLVSIALHLLTWRDPRFRSEPLAAGVLFGLCVLVRPFDAVVVAPVLLGFTLWLDRPGIRGLGDPLSLRCVRFWLPVAACGALVAISNAARFGSPLTFVPAGQTTIAFNHPVGAGLYGLLLNPNRGLILYSPPVILGLLAFPRFFRKRPDGAVLFAAIVAAYLLAYARYALWNDGVSWGARFLMPTVPFLILPAAAYLERRELWPRDTVLLVFVLGVAVQLAGTVVDHHRSVVLGRSAGTSNETSMTILAQWRHLVSGEHIDLFVVRIWEAAGPLAALSIIAAATLLIVVGMARLGGSMNLRWWSDYGKPELDVSSVDAMR